jgi:transposase
MITVHFLRDTGFLSRYRVPMNLEKCKDCETCRDLHWEVQYRRSMHARSMERESSLRDRNAELDRDLRRTKSEVAELTKQNEAMKAKLAWMQQQLFGCKTEQSQRGSGGQRSGGEGRESGQADRAAATRRGRGKQPGAKGNGRKPRTGLPAEQIDHDLAEDEKRCPDCGKPFVDFPGTEDSEEIDWEVRLVRRVHKRKRYRSTCNCKAVAGIVAAPCPAKLIPKGLFSCGFWVEVVLNKYLHGMPLYRIIRMLEMDNLSVSQGTLTGGLQKIAALLQPLYVLILERSRAAKHWHMDETRWMVFAELAGKASHRWWLWVIVTDETCAYIVDPSRSADVPRSHLGDDAEGILSADRYAAYKALGQAILVAYCWAHVRRDFIRIRDGVAKLSTWAASWVNAIDDLFGANAERRQTPCGSEPFQLADQSLREALKRMEQRRDGELDADNVHPSQSKVLVSLRNHWQGLTIFVDHPEIPMDNNEAERALRGPVVGRKNYYGSGSIWSGMLSAMLFTIIQTALLNNINPKPFVLEYFEACARNGGQAPRDLEEFLPWNLSEERKSQWKHKEQPP